MAVNPLKIRLGACDAMSLFGSVDLGASTGGAELNYTPTVLAVEIDQTIMPFLAYKTKEEVDFDVVLAQAQMNLLAAAYGYLSPTVNPVVTTAAGFLAGGSTTIPASPTALVLTGTPASVTYTYAVIPFCSNGDGIPSASAATILGPVSLSAISYFTFTYPGRVPGAVGYRVLRSGGGGSQGIIGTIYGNGGFTFVDNGLPATVTGYVPATANPLTPNVDQFTFGNNLYVPNGQFTFAVPKNDGSANHLRGLFYQAYSAKAIKLDFTRTKISELNKVSLSLLSDPTKPVGQQAGWVAEEY